MMKKAGYLFLLLCLAPTGSYAQGAAPEMFGVREVVVEYARFDDPTASETCGLSREQVASALAKAFAGSVVPWVGIIDAKPVASGVARIQLIPEISTYADESLDCVSWISLSAESHSRAIISPINTLRNVTALYWRQHTKVSTGQSIHQQKIDEVLQKMAAQFVQQYRLDQPPEIAQ
jgi:hypothetical protein